MRPRLVMSSALVVTLLVVCASMLAHHGNTAYDYEHPATITGNVTEFVWSNPHCQIYLDVNKSGAPVGFSGEKLGKVVFDDGHILKMDMR